jgi:3-phosphoshikimate 1-carboxyvinyltransferase
MPDIQLQPATRPLDAVVTIPGSKSLTNRALPVAALATGASALRNILLADDTRRMIDTLTKFDFDVIVNESTRVATVRGQAGLIPAQQATLDCGNSGTTIRFMAAMASLGAGSFLFDGTPRMRERPIGDLVNALRSLGAKVEFHAREGFPPFTVHATGLTGGTVTFNSPPSSQMVSALLITAPRARSDVMIELRGQIVSEPYIRMTIDLCESFGISIVEDRSDDAWRFIIPAPQEYAALDYDIEPDASNASYFLAAPAVAGGTVVVQGLGLHSIQGDAGFAEVLANMGCSVIVDDDHIQVSRDPSSQPLSAIDIDLNHMPDMAQTLAVLALFADGTTHIRNVANLRVKETNRLEALANELKKLGADVRLDEDAIHINPPQTPAGADIDTYDDHRMAMSFALAALKIPNITIKNAECVEKTFPDFFDRWKKMRTIL